MRKYFENVLDLQFQLKFEGSSISDLRKCNGPDVGVLDPIPPLREEDLEYRNLERSEDAPIVQKL